MRRRQTIITLFFGVMLAVAGSVAEAQLCWNCVRPDPVGQPNTYVCERTYVPQEGFTSCQETGFGPCIMGSPCAPMIESSVENTRPDGEVVTDQPISRLDFPSARYADLRGASYVRNCSGVITSRSYSLSRASTLKRESAVIVLDMGTGGSQRATRSSTQPAGAIKRDV